MPDINITINVDGQSNADVKPFGIKKTVKKRKLGQSTLLELPPAQDGVNKSNPILDILGV